MAITISGDGTISGVSLTASQVADATADLSYDAVGSYAWLAKSSYNSPITEGSTYAGSSLYPASMLANLYDDADTAVNRNTTAVSGTWQAMGGQGANLSDHPWNVTLFLRIA